MGGFGLSGTEVVGVEEVWKVGGEGIEDEVKEGRDENSTNIMILGKVMGRDITESYV